MRQALWPDDGPDSHAAEIEKFFAGELREQLAVFIAVNECDVPAGAAELSIRNYAEERLTDRVGYLEGWYVTPEARRRGIGRALVLAAEDWTRHQGCIPCGSDELIDNLT